MQLLEQEVRRTVLLALQEDQMHHDITTLACVSSEKSIQADFVLKQNSRTAGLHLLPWICHTIDPHWKLQVHVKDGSDCTKQTILASIEGKAQTILAGERTVLNLLQHVCGIANLTAQYVEAVQGFSCDILDTRKTLPGLRAIQKYAVTIGGGKNHRFHLKERFLIKNNHLKILKEMTSQPVLEAIRRAKTLHPEAKVEVEVESLDELHQALEGRAELILLDNMTPALATQCVAIAQGVAYLEASGGMNLLNVREFAAAGVNGISIGALTHSVPAVDISLRMS